jgi:hypothetical protein
MMPAPFAIRTTSFVLYDVMINKKEAEQAVATIFHGAGSGRLRGIYGPRRVTTLGGSFPCKT